MNTTRPLPLRPRRRGAPRPDGLLLPRAPGRRRRGARPGSVGATLGALLLVACGGGPGADADGGDAPTGDDAAATRPADGVTPDWQVLFDGSDLSAWRGYRQDDVPSAWQIEDGTLAFVPGAGEGGDLVTRDTFRDFELELSWRVEPGGNSGIFYRATEEEDWIYQSAPEMQVLDDERHPDGGSPLTSAGSNYGLHGVEEDVVHPASEWNHARIVVRGDHVEHWLNDALVVEYELGSDAWAALVADSKFAAWPAYGQADEGHIGLQDHGNRVWFRDIRVRRLDGEG